MLKQLELVRAEEKELKRRRREEKAKLKAKKMASMNNSESSSSESSESSDSECGEVVDMNQLRTEPISQLVQDHNLQPLPQEGAKLRKEEKAKLKAEKMASMNNSESSSSSSESSESSDSECGEVVDTNQLRTELISQLVQDHNLQPLPQKATKLPLSLPSSLTTNSVEELNRECGGPSTSSRWGTSIVDHVDGGELCNKRVEVCMGNKCRKSGGAALIEEFERVMGAEGAVMGCKCMGKCRSGPNVRVLNSIADESIRTTSNPLCIGVGLEDVSLIVANLFGEDTSDLGLAAAV